MIIRRITYTPYELKFMTPIWTSRGVIGSRRGFIIRMESESGFVGVGEAAPLPEFGTETADAARKMLDKLSRIKRPGRWPDSLEALREWIDLAVSMREVPTVQFGVESALLAGMCAINNTRLETLLSGNHAGSISANALLSGDSATVTSSAERAYQQGYATFKLKVGINKVEDDAEIIRKLRRQYPTVALRVDANGAWTLEQTREFLRLASKENLEYVEDPVSLDHLDDLGVLRKETSTPIAVDESARSLENISRLLDRGLCDVLVLKPSAIGSYDALAQIAERAREMKVVISHLYESEVGRSYLACAAAAFGSNNVAHGLASEKVIRGRLQVPDVRDLAESQT